MSTDKVLSAAALVIAIIVGAYAVTHPSVTKVVTTTSDGSQSQQTYSGVPVLQSPLCVNGVCKGFDFVGMNTATNTPCVFKVTSTSTLNRFSAIVSTGTSTAYILQLATSTIPNATTTQITTQSIASGAQGQLIFIGTLTEIMTPNTYVTLGVQGGKGANSGVGGSCEIETSTLTNH